MARTLTERVLEYSPEREAYAWNEYLQTCRECVDENYPEVEAWAWVRLRRRLGHPPLREKP